AFAGDARELAAIVVEQHAVAVGAERGEDELATIIEPDDPEIRFVERRELHAGDGVPGVHQALNGVAGLGAAHAGRQRHEPETENQRTRSSHGSSPRSIVHHPHGPSAATVRSPGGRILRWLPPRPDRYRRGDLRTSAAIYAVSALGTRAGRIRGDWVETWSQWRTGK